MEYNSSSTKMIQYFYDQKGKDKPGWKSAIDHYFKLKRKINRHGDHIIDSGYIEFEPKEKEGEEDVYKLTISLAHKKKVCPDCNGEGHIVDPVMISNVYENCCPSCKCTGYVKTGKDLPPNWNEHNYLVELHSK